MNIEQIRIGFEENDEEITHIVLPSVPFQAGQKITLSVDNKLKDKWDVEDFECTEFEIISISYAVNIAYVAYEYQYVNCVIKLKRINSK